MTLSAVSHFSLQKNVEESMNRWRNDLDEAVYLESKKVLDGRPLMRHWRDADLALKSDS